MCSLYPPALIDHHTRDKCHRSDNTLAMPAEHPPFPSRQPPHPFFLSSKSLACIFLVIAGSLTTNPSNSLRIST